MKHIKKFTATLMACSLVFHVVLFGILQAFAHEAMLDVSYDVCIDVPNDDGINEMWYVINTTSKCIHISHEENTIKYYFEEVSKDGTYTWTTDVSEAEANDIKTAYANSMKKWNNVYFYARDASGNMVKKKIINVIEGTASDHNLSIYPTSGTTGFAATYVDQDQNINIEDGSITHIHNPKWKMEIDIDGFHVGEYTATEVAVFRERTGAHELGHILGLRDVDKNNACGAGVGYNHHKEILMGYGYPLINRCPDITYKDIAGVAITRGFHTDNDHQWLNAGLQSDGTYKLICSICNGVKKVNSLQGYSYHTYASCNDNHTLSSGNMMAVACYGTKDYYKCKYCRYVASYSSIVSQDYTISYADSTYHKCVNHVAGLTYTLYEEHHMTQNGCLSCGYLHTHSYSPYTYKDNSSHIRSCTLCRITETAPHYIRSSDIVDGRYAPCLGCHKVLDLFKDSAQVGLAKIAQVSIHGSYILSNGIVVLVDEDIEAYVNGTLRFYDIDDVPVTE